ncbi:hypothetical protein [Georgenia yuyongxinii]
MRAPLGQAQHRAGIAQAPPAGLGLVEQVQQGRLRGRVHPQRDPAT